MTAAEKAIKNARKLLRNHMVKIARAHRKCSKPRGCGCFVDKALTVLEQAEAQLFKCELESYAGESAKALQDDPVER